MSKPASPREGGCFKQSLESIMNSQKESFPQLNIPRILAVLSDAIIKLNGTKMEGIFRVPATAGDATNLRNQLDEGNFEIDPKTEVHTTAAVLKLWFRELPDPLIPTNFYETCTESPEKAMSIINQLPPINQNVAIFTINFLQEFSKAEHVEATRMSKENLAMVFSPSFLRCPYQDPHAVLSSAEKEKKFLLNLLDEVPFNGFTIPSLQPVVIHLTEAPSDQPPPDHPIQETSQPSALPQSPTTGRRDKSFSVKKTDSVKLT